MGIKAVRQNVYTCLCTLMKCKFLYIPHTVAWTIL